MRIGLGYLLQETNSFSPVPTVLEDFHPLFGSDVRDHWAGTRTEIGAFLDVLNAAGHEPVPLFAGWAMTGGPVLNSAFAEIRSRATEELQSAGGLDGLLLALHGSMAAQDTDDCEGELLASIRQIAGSDLPIVLTLDLHANLTRRIVSSVNAIIGYKTWPHEDMYETGEHGARLLLKVLQGEASPVVVMKKLPMILPAERMHTGRGPMRDVFDAGEEYRASHPGVLSVSVFGVQPWLDVAEMGCATVAVADHNLSSAEECASQMAQEFWDLREAFEVKLKDAPQALAEALAIEGSPVILAEPTDSPTAGSPGDSAELLRLFLERAPKVPSLLWIRDADVVEQAWQARPGAVIQATLGGALDKLHHKPVVAQARVRSLSDGRFRFRGSYNTGMLNEMGRTAVLQSGEATIVVSELAASNIDPELYRSQGLRPEDYKLVVVKSAGSFRPQFEGFASRILVVDTPGICTPNLRHLPYRRVPRPIHPLDEIDSWNGRHS